MAEAASEDRNTPRLAASVGPGVRADGADAAAPVPDGSAAAELALDVEPTREVALSSSPPLAPPERKGVKRGDRQSRFLAQSVILEESGSSGLIRAAMMTIAAVITGFVIWASLTDVDEVAVATGEVVPTGRVQTIQHLEGGIISAILAKEGDIVEAGQVLVRMDPAAAIADLDQVRAREAALILQAERQRAIGTGREPDFSIVRPEYQAMASDQESIYRSQKLALEKRRGVLLDQVKQRQAEIRSLQEKEENQIQHLALLEEELTMREALYKKGLSTKVLYLTSQRDVNRARGELTGLVTDLDRAADSLAEVRSRLIELETNQREVSLTEMGTVGAELAQVREQLHQREARVLRLEVASPLRGIVKGLTNHTIGGVVVPGGILMEIVPLDEELIVEAKISSRDVGHVTVGQPVRVKVVTYDYARYGGITGELRSVSPSTFLDEKGVPYYLGIISLDRGYVGYDPERNRVLPGMTVQADINTGKKTLIAYLLKPVYSSVSESFRER